MTKGSKASSRGNFGKKLYYYEENKMFRNKNIRNIIAFFMAIFMAVQILYTPYLEVHAQDVSGSAYEGDTITTNVRDGFVQKAFRRTIDVWARNADDEKIDSKAYLDDDEVAYNWNDNVKTSYTFDFSNYEDGQHTIRIVAGNASVTYKFTLQKAKEGEFIGYAVFSLEAFTISKGYLVEPKLIPIYQGETSAQVLLRYLDDEGYAYDYTGDPTSGFYLAQIYGSNHKNASKYNPAPKTVLDLTGAKLEENVESGYGESCGFDEDDYENGKLGEFDFCSFSGWMYSVDNDFPNVGFADYYLSPGEVVRIQFTVNLGVELGEKGYNEDEPAYVTADKGELTALMASVNSSDCKEALLNDGDIATAMKKAEANCQNMACSQNEVDNTSKELKSAIEKKEAEITGITLDKEEAVAQVGSTFKLSASTMPAGSAYSGKMTFNSSNTDIATVDKDGNVTALALGSCEIIATFGKFEKRCSLEVTEKKVELQLNITPQDAIVNITDSAGEPVEDITKGTYELLSDTDYSLKVSKYGYKTYTEKINLNKNESKNINLEKAADDELEKLSSDWSDLRNSSSNNGMIPGQTAITASQSLEKWSKKLDKSTLSEAIIVADDVVLTSGNTIYKINKNTGEVSKTAALLGTAVSDISPVYAQGMIFVGLSGGKVEALNAKTLQSLWIYSSDLSGDTTSLKYNEGYLYFGIKGEKYHKKFVCLSTTDEDVNKTDEVKASSWEHNLWGYNITGAYVNEKGVYFLVDGQEKAGLYAIDKQGVVMDFQDEYFKGKISSDLSYDKDSNRIIFATKEGYIYSVKLTDDPDYDFQSIKSYQIRGYSSSIPLVHNGRVYVGSNNGNNKEIVVLNISKDGEFTESYRYSTDFTILASGLLTTAYEDTYVYFTENKTSGGIICLKDNVGQTEADVSEIYLPTENTAGSSKSLIADKNGNIYYINDAGTVTAVEKNTAFLNGIDVTGISAIIDSGKEFDSSKKEHTIAVDEGTTQFTLSLNLPENALATINGQAGKEAKISVSGQKTITVVVTKDGKERTYILNIVDKSHDATLAQLEISNAVSRTTSRFTLSPEFKADVTDYTATIDKKVTSAINIWPLLNDSKASLKVYPVSEIGSNTVILDDGSIKLSGEVNKREKYSVFLADNSDTAKVRVEVTAEDGITKESYSVILKQQETYPPIIKNLNCSDKDRTLTGTKISFESNEDGKLYYVVKAKGSEAPDSVEIIETLGKTVVYGANEITIDELPDEGCEIYFVVNDGTNTSSIQHVSVAANENYENKVAADAVVEKINEITKIEVTDECKALIEEARNAYDSLREGAKKFVPDDSLKKLTDAEKEYKELTTVSDISLKSTSATLYVGGKVTIVSEISPATALNKEVTYKSSNSKVATVNVKGIVTAKKAGTATITVTTKDQEKTAKYVVKVINNTITLNSKKVVLYTKTKTSATLKATVRGLKNTVTWKSSNPKVATVNAKGLVKAKKAGNTTITATANGVSVTCSVKVAKATLTIKKSHISIKKGKTAYIGAKATPKAKITYKSSNKKIASVDSKGYVKGKKTGRVKITITANGITKKVEVFVS
ncbi:PEGA domain-containing protein [Acetitomaculum ruminis DSM 5522]|uniref:PEGA domain-containing protein n=1 Tax=Acetitomaculum ruminis DSM 5522 TaxID=1120918 RepID=A0A1I0W6I4_9FIRM|nr:Ig-like domain-containing protein [Acetitomaculum ruminis]SFA84365.1 PEGA domain-containing protein [Acetitomaculum ruminis DSM 5522]